MNNNNLFWLLICGHLIGDFYFQSQKMADGKKQDEKIIYIHVVLYGLAVLIMLLPILNFRLFWMVFLFVVVSHFIIDLAKNNMTVKTAQNSFVAKNIFIYDQIVHIAILIIFASIYANNNVIALSKVGVFLFAFYKQLNMSISPSELLRLVIVFLIICKPANILIKEINSKDKIILDGPNYYKTNDQKQDKKTKEPEYVNAGKLIGILERILTVILVILNQYAAVGLIFAAKSLTRYDKITKEPSFAEYYLVGTLLSLLIAIGAVLVVQPI